MQSHETPPYPNKKKNSHPSISTPPILHPFPRSLSTTGRSPTWMEAGISSYEKKKKKKKLWEGLKLGFCSVWTLLRQQTKTTKIHTRLVHNGQLGVKRKTMELQNQAWMWRVKQPVRYLRSKGCRWGASTPLVWILRDKRWCNIKQLDDAWAGRADWGSESSSRLQQKLWLAGLSGVEHHT